MLREPNNLPWGAPHRMTLYANSELIDGNDTCVVPP